MKGRKKLYGEQPTITVTLLLRQESLVALDAFAQTRHESRSKIIDDLISALAASYE